ncbi:MAG TPA: TetR/AcrR family transcriptional regulator [Humibacter sp.]|jgi:AcrR family transcriptional regulator|nr:TetR/AcrR family transcriptional regulator [Humibacter sp.]
MARRGDALREHILDVAKIAFLESGFAHTSMDAVAARAETSKRSLYAHFATKDVLVQAVIERTRDLLSGRMPAPEHYSDDPVEAAARYCGRLVQLLRWSTVAQTCRLGISEATRLPEAAAGIYDAIFGQAGDRLAGYLREQLRMKGDEARSTALLMIAQAVYPTLPRVLFGTDRTVEQLPVEEQLDADVDLPGIRRIVRLQLETGSTSA